MHCTLTYLLFRVQLYAQIIAHIDRALKIYQYQRDLDTGRLEAVTKEEVLRRNRAKTKKEVHPEDIDRLHKSWTTDLKQCEVDLAEKLGKLNYLMHLKRNKELEKCPICLDMPTDKVIGKLATAVAIRFYMSHLFFHKFMPPVSGIELRPSPMPDVLPSSDQTPNRCEFLLRCLSLRAIGTDVSIHCFESVN